MMATRLCEKQTSEFFKNSGSSLPSILQRIQILLNILRQLSCSQIFQNELAILIGGIEAILNKGFVDQFAIAFTDPFEVIGVLPLRNVCNKSVFDGVAMNVSAQIEQIR